MCVCVCGPTLHQVVLERSPGQHHPAPRSDGAHGLGDVRRFVLQDVALVADHKVWTCMVQILQHTFA